MIELDFDDPTFVATIPFSLDTSEGNVEFEAGDPIQVSLHNNGIEYVVGSGETVLYLNGEFAREDLLKVIAPARFEECEDDSGVFFKNIYDSSDPKTQSVESLVSRMTTVNESSGRSIRVTKITIKTPSGE